MVEEGLDPEEDHDREDQGLDDFEQATECRSLTHRDGSIGARPVLDSAAA